MISLAASFNALLNIVITKVTCTSSLKLDALTTMYLTNPLIVKGSNAYISYLSHISKTLWFTLFILSSCIGHSIIGTKLFDSFS